VRAAHPEEDPDAAKTIEFSALGKRVMEQYSTKQRQDFEEKLAKTALVKKKQLDLDEHLSVGDFLAERRERKDWRHERHTTGQMAHSVTSTYIDLKTSDEKRALSDLEMLGVVWMEIKSFHHKTFLQLQTNLGEMNVELFSDQAVRTCYSFLELVYKGLLSGMKFKRLVPGAFLQMENAVSRTLKLDTVDRSEKLFHKKPYLLTVDTLGGLNTFGITLAETPLLDRTNSVFGQVMTNPELLDLVDQAGEEDGLPHVAAPHPESPRGPGRQGAARPLPRDLPPHQAQALRRRRRDRGRPQGARGSREGVQAHGDHAEDHIDVSPYSRDTLKLLLSRRL